MTTDIQSQPGQTDPADSSDKLDKRVLMVAGVVVLGAIMSILDITVVSVALATFQSEFDATAGRSLAANIALVKNNAALAAQIAGALANL